MLVRVRFVLILLLIAAAVTAVVASLSARAEAGEPLPPSAAAEALVKRLEPFHVRLGEPQAGEWRERFKEPGQTFAQYRVARPNLPTAKRRTICLTAAGTFSAEQQAVVDRVAEFLAAYYQLPVRRLDPLTVDAPAGDRRPARDSGEEQIRTGWFLDRLAKVRTDDAIACLALTSSDLWPGDDWNYVFGQATLRERVGVWSLARLADPQPHLKRGLTLRRALKIAVHETGHMFSIEHCTAYKCLMQGSNSLSETDSQPLDACPECTAKIVWMSRCDPAARYRDLARLGTIAGLVEEAAVWTKLAEALPAAPP